MKKAITLLAGMMLVAGQVMAIDNWDFSGTYVEWETKLIDTQDGILVDDSDANLLLNAKWDVNENLGIRFEVDTDDETFAGEHGDNAISMAFQYNNGSDFEISLDLAIPTDGGTRITVDEGSDATYLKWAIAEGVKLGFYPYNIGTDIGDTFATANTAQIPGVVYEAANFYAGLGSYAYSGKNIISVKAGINGGSDKISYRVDYVGAFGEVDLYNSAVEAGGSAKDPVYIEQAVNLGLGVVLTDTFNLQFEGGYTLASELFAEDHPDVDDTGLGIFARANKDMDKFVTFVAATYVTEGFLFDDDPSLLSGVAEGAHGGYTKVEAGFDFPLHSNITLTTSVQHKMTENNVYRSADNDGVDINKLTENTATSLNFAIIGRL